MAVMHRADLKLSLIPEVILEMSAMALGKKPFFCNTVVSAEDLQGKTVCLKTSKYHMNFVQYLKQNSAKTQTVIVEYFNIMMITKKATCGVHL